MDLAVIEVTEEVKEELHNTIMELSKFTTCETDTSLLIKPRDTIISSKFIEDPNAKAFSTTGAAE